MSAHAPTLLDTAPVSSNEVTYRWLHLQNLAGTALHLNTTAELAEVGYADGRSDSVA